MATYLDILHRVALLVLIHLPHLTHRFEGILLRRCIVESSHLMDVRRHILSRPLQPDLNCKIQDYKLEATEANKAIS